MSYLRDNCQLLSLSEMILDNCGEFSCGMASILGKTFAGDLFIAFSVCHEDACNWRTGE